MSTASNVSSTGEYRIFNNIDHNESIASAPNNSQPMPGQYRIFGTEDEKPETKPETIDGKSNESQNSKQQGSGFGKQMRPIVAVMLALLVLSVYRARNSRSRNHEYSSVGVELQMRPQTLHV